MYVHRVGVGTYYKKIQLILYQNILNTMLRSIHTVQWLAKTTLRYWYPKFIVKAYGLKIFSSLSAGKKLFTIAN